MELNINGNTAEDGPGITELGVLKIKSASFPEYLFEYHPESKRVYCIPIASTEFKDGIPHHVAHIIAQHVPNATVAKAFVASWIAGYKAGYESPAKLIINPE